MENNSKIAYYSHLLLFCVVKGNRASARLSKTMQKSSKNFPKISKS